MTAVEMNVAARARAATFPTTYVSRAKGTSLNLFPPKGEEVSSLQSAERYAS